MALALLVPIVLVLVGLRPFKRNSVNSDYLSRDVTLVVCGAFTIIVFLSHFLTYVDHSSFNILDKLGQIGTGILGQLMVAPFLFFSGYGIFTQYSQRGPSYADAMPKKRILKVYLSFLVAWLFFAVTALALHSPYQMGDYLWSLIGLKTIGNSNWYVVVILLLYVLSYFSFKLAISKRMALGLNFLFSLTLIVFLWRLGAEAYWYNTIVAYVAGIAYAYYRFPIDRFLFARRPNRFIAFASSILLFGSTFAISHFVYYPWLNELLYAVRVVFFCLGIVFFLSMFRIKSKILFYLGTNTFWFYILQRLPMIWAGRINFLSSNRYVYFGSVIIILVPLVFLVSKAFNYIWNLFAERKGQADESTNIKLGVTIAYLSLGVSLLASFIVTPRLLNALGDSQYGLYSFATSITSWLTVIYSALSASYLRFASKAAKEEGATNRVNTAYFALFVALSGIILLVLGIGLSVFYFSGFRLPQYNVAENNLIYLLILISGINVAVSVLFSVFNNFITYKRQFIFARSLGLLFSLLTFAFNLIFALITHSVIAIAIVAVIIGLLSNLIYALYCFRSLKMKFDKPNLKRDSPLIRSIFIFSAFVLLNAVVDQINNNVDKTILGIMADAESVTYYTLSKYFSAYLLALSISISGSYAPRVHELVNNQDKEGLSNLFLKVSKLQMLVLFLFGGGFLACGLEFMELWLGADRAFIYYYALIPITLDVVALSCNLGVEVQRAMNKHKFRAFLYIALALTNVGISILCIRLLPKEYAILGAYIGTIFSVVLGNWLILNIYNHRVIGLPIGRYFLNVLKVFLFTCFSAVPAILCRYLLPAGVPVAAKFIIEGGLFVILFVGCLFLFERKTALEVLKRIVSKFSKRT